MKKKATKGSKAVLLYASYFQHPKFFELQSRTGDHGVLCHIRLLTWTGLNKPDGNLSGMDNTAIEKPAGWNGEPGEFVEILVELKLLDGKTGKRKIHDFAEWNPKVVDYENIRKVNQKNAKKGWNKRKSSEKKSSANSKKDSQKSVENDQKPHNEIADAPSSNAEHSYDASRIANRIAKSKIRNASNEHNKCNQSNQINKINVCSSTYTETTDYDFLASVTRLLPERDNQKLLSNQALEFQRLVEESGKSPDWWIRFFELNEDYTTPRFRNAKHPFSWLLETAESGNPRWHEFIDNDMNNLPSDAELISPGTPEFYQACQRMYLNDIDNDGTMGITHLQLMICTEFHAKTNRIPEWHELKSLYGSVRDEVMSDVISLWQRINNKSPDDHPDAVTLKNWIDSALNCDGELQDQILSLYQTGIRSVFSRIEALS